METRDSAWLAQQRERISQWPFDKLLSIVRWDDPNGAWSERELEEYGTTQEDLVDVVMVGVEETGETPEEWISGSRRPYRG